MFHSSLKQYQSQSFKLINSSPSRSSFTTSPDLDLQYELYSRYLHISKEQLAIQQLTLMKDSQTLLQSINLSTKTDTSRDIHSTMDSVCCDDDFENSIIQEFSAIERRTPKKITRKSQRQSILKPMGRADDDFTQILSEIERNCTENTFTSVKSLVQEHKKNLSKMVEVQKKQKTVRRLQEKTEKLQQQNAIFRLKLGEVQEKIKAKDDEIRTLKERISQLKVSEKQNIRAQKLSRSSNSKSFQDHYSSIVTPYHFSVNQNNTLSQYLQQKQSHLAQRTKHIQQIEARIQNLIQQSVIGDTKNSNNNVSDSSKQKSCIKCCQMIKKIKGSVMQYRKYLEEEGDECQKLYNMLKAQMERCLTDRKVEGMENV